MTVAAKTASRTSTQGLPKTRWQRMQKTDLALDHLKTLLLTSKRADGLSNLTLRWYENGIGGFCAWLERTGHEPVSYTHLTLPTNREV